MHDEMSPAVVRIFSAEGEGYMVGMGFLISPRYIISCAHVVADALNISQKTVEMPTSPVYTHEGHNW